MKNYPKNVKILKITRWEETSLRHYASLVCGIVSIRLTSAGARENYKEYVRHALGQAACKRKTCKHGYKKCIFYG